MSSDSIDLQFNDPSENPCDPFFSGPGKESYCFSLPSLLLGQATPWWAIAFVTLAETRLHFSHKMTHSAELCSPQTFYENN